MEWLFYVLLGVFLADVLPIRFFSAAPKPFDFSQEYILCAANWYKDLTHFRPNLHPSLIYPTNVTQGLVFCGHRHPHCMYHMIAVTNKRQCEAGEEVQGFLTSKNRFVNREEAAKIALATGQIKKLNYGSKRLYSEDLYI